MEFCRECKTTKKNETDKVCRECGLPYSTQTSPIQTTSITNQEHLIAQPTVKFCRECGTPRKNESDAICRECGSSYPAPKTIEEFQDKNTIQELTEVHESPAPEEKPSEEEKINRTEKKKKGKPVLKWIVSISATAAIGSGLGFAYSYLQNVYGVEDFVGKAEAAIERKDINALQDMIVRKDNAKTLSQEDIKKLIDDIEASEETKKKVLTSLDIQKESLINKENTEPYILEISKSDEKKWLIIPQYELSVVPVTFYFKVPLESKVTINDMNVEVDKKGVVSVEDIVPGVYDITITKDSESVESTVEAWDTTDLDTSEIDDSVAQLENGQAVETTIKSADEEETDTSSESSDEVSKEKVQEFIDEYLTAGVKTFNERDMDYITPYLEPNSVLFKSTADYLVTLSERGIYEELLEADVLHIEEVEENVYNVTVFSKYNISFNNGETEKYQTYNVVYQIVKDGDSFLTRKIVKEELVEKEDIAANSSSNSSDI